MVPSATATLYSRPVDLGGFERILRTGEGRRVKRLAGQAAYITSLEPDFQKLSDDELRANMAEFRQRLENGETLDTCSSSHSRPCARRASGSRISGCSTCS